jgi:hypothetical protein
MGGGEASIRLERKISFMPNLDLPPDPSGVDDRLYESVTRKWGTEHFLVDFVKSRPAGHELHYMKRRYNYKDFEFAAHHAIENPLHRQLFLLKSFSQARKRAAISIGARLAIGLLILLPFLIL